MLIKYVGPILRLGHKDDNTSRSVYYM